MNYSFALNPNISDETFEKCIEMMTEHRKKMHVLDTKLMQARFAHDREMLEIQQRPSRLMKIDGLI